MNEWKRSNTLAKHSSRFTNDNIMYLYYLFFCSENMYKVYMNNVRCYSMLCSTLLIATTEALTIFSSFFMYILMNTFPNIANTHARELSYIVLYISLLILNAIYKFYLLGILKQCWSQFNMNAFSLHFCWSKITLIQKANVIIVCLCMFVGISFHVIFCSVCDRMSCSWDMKWVFALHFVHIIWNVFVYYHVSNLNKCI